METPYRRRKELMALHTGIDFDPEDVVDLGTIEAPTPIIPDTSPSVPAPAPPGFTPEEARRQQLASVPGTMAGPELRIDLAAEVTLRLMRIPAASSGPPFWMGATEITNRQYACFDPSHDSRLEHGEFLQFSIRERGYPLNAPDQPVVRVSQRKAMAFCEWLSQETGRQFTLPTESQWEFAARAGTTTALWYGDLGDDFSTAANLSDATHHSRPTFGWSLPSGAIPGWRPARTDVDDKHRVSAPVASFAANAFGLHDMAGNVAEWTRLADGTTDAIARGGSWQDTPDRATSTIRVPYHPHQNVVDVGFRVICE
jgi:formylglycine-generating enzyme required for sulfatase activity